MVKNLPAVQETQVQSLGQEDPLEKDMATHSRILAWEIPWTEGPGGLQSMGSQRVRHNRSNFACKYVLMVHLSRVHPAKVNTRGSSGEEGMTLDLGNNRLMIDSWD